MSGKPLTITSTPSGTTMSIPPMMAVALTVISGVSMIARRKSSSTPPMMARALVVSAGRHWPFWVPPLMMPTVHVTAGRVERTSPDGSALVTMVVWRSSTGRSLSTISISPRVRAS
jgi:hypothetical protein